LAIQVDLDGVVAQRADVLRAHLSLQQQGIETRIRGDLQVQRLTGLDGIRADVRPQDHACLARIGRRDGQIEHTRRIGAQAICVQRCLTQLEPLRGLCLPCHQQAATQSTQSGQKTATIHATLPLNDQKVRKIK